MWSMRRKVYFIFNLTLIAQIAQIFFSAPVHGTEHLKIKLYVGRNTNLTD